MAPSFMVGTLRRHWVTFMINIRFISTALAVVLASHAAACGLPSFPLVPGQAIVRTANPKALAQTITALSKQFQGVGIVDQIDGRPIYLLSYQLNEFQTPHDVDLLLNGLVAQGTLSWTELNYVGQTGEGNTDSLWLSGVGVNSNNYFNQYASPMLGIDLAHARSLGAGILVSVIDTGIDASHPAFGGMVSTTGASFVPGATTWSDIADGSDSDGDGVPNEQYGHGTFVAGLIHLVAPEAMIISARALDSDGRGNTFRIAQAVAWSIDRGAHVVNMSLGEVYHSKALESMVLEASTRGVIVCGAAGNRNTEDPREFPACDPNAFGVSACNWNDQKAPFSNLEVRLDFAAPGDSNLVNGIPVLSECIIGPVPGGNFAIWEGTSFSNAFISGTVALVRSQRPDWPSATALPPTILNRVYGVLADSGMPIVPNNPAHAGLLGIARISASGAVLENPPAARRGDLNTGGFVNSADLSVMLNAWGQAPTFIRSDLNADGRVDARDLSILLDAW